MHHFKIFIEITRLTKPIGFMLLFWPCSWGLAYAYIENSNLSLFVYYLFLFFLGSVLMRSAGCIFNDIVDKDFDKKVQRTKYRPLAAGKITVTRALVYVLTLCSIAFLVLIQFNLFTILLGLGSMFLAFSYPFMKRITYWPQLFLGFTFNWGIIMAWVAFHNSITIEIVLLYISAIFWTLGYDTIYGAQDMSDDQIIGLKSTSIKFKNNIHMFVSTSYVISIGFMLFLFKNFVGQNTFTFLFLIFILSLIYQLIILKKNNPNQYLGLFKTNNVSGLFLFLGIFSISL